MAANALGGKFMPDPLSTAEPKVIQEIIQHIASFLNGKNTISVHPLGGCIMADTGLTGVVNHKGQVFIGKNHSGHRSIKTVFI